MRDSANALIKTSTNTIPTNQWVRIEAHVVQAGASSTVQLLYYASANATTATEDMGTTTFTGGANMDQFHYGTITSTPQVPTLRYGNVALGTTKVGPFGTSGGGGGNIPSPWHEYRAFAK
jgi:predicted amidohydrolase